MTAARRFPVPPAGKAAWATLLALGLALPGGAIGLAFWLDPPTGEERWILAAALAFVALVGSGLAALLKRRSIELGGATLTVRAAMYTRRVPLASMDLDRARVVDLGEHTEFKPLVKTNGYALPGFQAGYYRLRDRSKAFALVTEWRRVLFVPVPGDASLLLSPEHPAALLDALKRNRHG